MPVRFQEAPTLKKPGKRASQQDHEQYRQLKKTNNLSTQTLDMIRSLRDSVDQRGGSQRPLIIVGDGSFSNKTMFSAELDRTPLVTRCRKDARLFFPAPGGSRRKYDKQIFTPEQVRQNHKTLRWARAYLRGKH